MPPFPNLLLCLILNFLYTKYIVIGFEHFLCVCHFQLCRNESKRLVQSEDWRDLSVEERLQYSLVKVCDG